MRLSTFARFEAIAAGAICFALISGIFAPAAAQAIVETSGEETEAAPTLPAMPAGSVSCFDYYHFGSVQAKFSAQVATVVSGGTIAFSGSLVNSNPYPIVDGSLYVKVFKKRPGPNDGNGHDVVEQATVLSDLAIPANGSIPATFSWKVPANAVSGEYELATFFVTSRKFNLLGLSFTDDVVGNTTSFIVEGEQTQGVAIDKASVKVNGVPYRFAAPPPRTQPGATATITADVRNALGKDESVVISWAVYQWDALLRENLVQEETQQVFVPAKGAAKVSITVQDARYPVYLAVGTLSWKDTKSIIGVRFAREGVNRPRINFPGVTSFPLIKGQESTLFSCVHNSGEGHIVPGGRLELTLSDLKGNLISEHAYTGDVTGAMMGIAKPFVPQRTHDRFVLSARLYSGEEFIDEANLVYDCARIDPALCISSSASGGFLASLFANRGWAMLGVLVLILAIVLAAFSALRHRQPPTPPQPPMQPPQAPPPTTI